MITLIYLKYYRHSKVKFQKFYSIFYLLCIILCTYIMKSGYNIDSLFIIKCGKLNILKKFYFCN